MSPDDFGLFVLFLLPLMLPSVLFLLTFAAGG